MPIRILKTFIVCKLELLLLLDHCSHGSSHKYGLLLSLLLFLLFLFLFAVFAEGGTPDEAAFIWGYPEISWSLAAPEILT